MDSSPATTILDSPSPADFDLLELVPDHLSSNTSQSQANEEMPNSNIAVDTIKPGLPCQPVAAPEAQTGIEPPRDRTKSRSPCRCSADLSAAVSSQEDSESSADWNQQLFEEFGYKLNDPWQEPAEEPEVVPLQSLGLVIRTPHRYHGSCYHDATSAKANAACRSLGLPLSFACGAAMSIHFGGSAKYTSVIDTMIASLPIDIQTSAKEILRRASAILGLKLMSSQMPCFAHANSHIKSLLQTAHLKQFYIGITEAPCARYDEHRASGYRVMAVWVLEDSRQSGGIEDDLILAWRSCPLCNNVGRGRLGASKARPHFLYVVHC